MNCGDEIKDKINIEGEIERMGDKAK